MFMNLTWPMLIENSHGGIGMNFIHGHCHDGMAGGEAGIVSIIFRGVVCILPEQPGPEATLALWLSRPVARVIRVFLRVAPDHDRWYSDSFQMQDGSLRGRRRIDGSNNHFSH